MAYNAVASVAFKTNVCCVLALGHFSLGIFKFVDTTNFILLVSTNLMLVIPQHNSLT